MKKTCTLCGGKLRDGICTECGMNNKKSDAMYDHILNQGECKGSRLTHIHENGKEKQYEQPVINKSRSPEREKRVQKKTQYQPTEAYKSRKYVSSDKKKEKNKISWLLIAISIFVSFGGVTVLVDGINGLINSLSPEPEYEWSESSSEASSMEENYECIDDPYAYVEEELNPVGEVWEGQLPAGIYMVGVDIPEGEYTLTGGEESCYGVYDKAHYLNVEEMIGISGQTDFQAEGVKLFDGAIVYVKGFYPVRFYTENAQLNSMRPRIENPLTESIELTGHAVAGEDFPAGTYDVYMQEDEFQIFEYNVHLGEDTIDFTGIVLMSEEASSDFPGCCSVYKNVVFPEWAFINLEEHSSFTLVPSEGIVSEDYIAFYDNIY